jgi:hypothetical protein
MVSYGPTLTIDYSTDSTPDWGGPVIDFLLVDGDGETPTIPDEGPGPILPPSNPAGPLIPA